MSMYWHFKRCHQVYLMNKVHIPLHTISEYYVLMLRLNHISHIHRCNMKNGIICLTPLNTSSFSLIIRWFDSFCKDNQSLRYYIDLKHQFRTSFSNSKISVLRGYRKFCLPSPMFDKMSDCTRNDGYSTGLHHYFIPALIV